MILNENYDKNILLMLDSDKINNNKIIHFLSAIPEKLQLEIKKALIVYNEYKGSTSQIANMCTSKNGLCYYYELDSKNNMLFITGAYKRGKIYHPIMQLTLNLAFNSYEDLSWIGTINYGFKEDKIGPGEFLYDYKQVDYSLEHTLFGNRVVKNYDGLKIRKHVNMSKYNGLVNYKKKKLSK